jgi:hypothetical protein
MSKLWTCGCSHTADYTTNLIMDREKGPYHYYADFKGGNFPDTWPRILGNKLGLEVENLGFPGACNYTIFQQFNDNIKNMSEGDVVIIGWSFVHRFRMAHPNGKHFTPFTHMNNDRFDYWSESTFEEIFYNRTLKPYIQEVYSWMQLLDELASFKGLRLFYFSCDYDLINGEIIKDRNNPKYLFSECNTGMIDYLRERYGATTITEETKGQVVDGHFGYDGHTIMAEKLYNDLIKKI